MTAQHFEAFRLLCFPARVASVAGRCSSRTKSSFQLKNMRMFYNHSNEIFSSSLTATQTQWKKADEMEYKCNVLYSFSYNLVPFFPVISLLCASFKSYQCRMMNLKEKRVLCFSVQFRYNAQTKGTESESFIRMWAFSISKSWSFNVLAHFTFSCQPGDQRNMFHMNSNISHKHPANR